MNYNIIKRLPSAEEIRLEIPLSAAGYQKINQDREEIKNILAGRDHRLLIVVGPCSAWPKSAVLDYAEKLVGLSEQLKTRLKIVMRVYSQKPRTTKGWIGSGNQSDPLAYPDIAAGMRYTREMMVKTVEMGLPIADEILFTHQVKGLIELLAWAAIGARSTEDQEHRIFASALNCAVGMKNPTHGALAVGVNSVLAAQTPHVAVFDGDEVQTGGNPYAHLVLRGNDQGPNYGIDHLQAVQRWMHAHQVRHPGVIIDASHDNCLRNGKKDYRLQPAVVFEVMESLAQHPDLKPLVKGFMIESFLKSGQQKIDPHHPEAIDLNGLSITDGCLGWPQTESLLLKLAELLC
jgi:3-deoxy-7-phosphoheptulonate synthase